MRTGACLLIDNSNTRTKFALAMGGKVSELRVLPTGELSMESICQLLAGWCFEQVCCSSVVPQTLEIIKDALKDYPLRVVHAGIDCGVNFSTYAGAATLGADRVVNALAAVRLVELPLVAVDMGTATTFEVVVQGEGGPRFAGGIITPGFQSFAACLPSCTAQLPEVIRDTGAPFIGRDTHEAMSAGVVTGYAGMLDSLLEGIEKELGKAVNIVLTGGDAAFFAPLLRHPSLLVPDLTIQGLAIAAGVR